jgi:LCP family protein required for cell wall assembly
MFTNKRYLLYIIVLIILCAAILIPLLRVGVTSAGTQGSKVSLVKAPFNSTPTATAFQPLASTQAYIPTDYPAPQPTFTPKPVIIRPVNPTKGVDPITQPDGQFTIMVLGSDQKHKGFIGRTDTIILLTINTNDQTVNATSFPRDLYIHIPGWTSQRINTAFSHGGFKTFQDTMAHNFGFSPDYYVLVNLWAFEYIVNNLGGIYVNVPRTICDGKWGAGQSHCTYQGSQHFYGREALWYVRSRMTTNDFDRNYRQQLVLKAIFDRLFSLNSITKIPQLYSTYIQNITTNLDLTTIAAMSQTAAKLIDTNKINQYFISENMVSAWITPAGAQVLLPKFDVIRRTLESALNSP